MEDKSFFLFGPPREVLSNDLASKITAQHSRSRYPLYSVVPPSCPLLSLRQKQPAAFNWPLASSSTVSSLLHTALISFQLRIHSAPSMAFPNPPLICKFSLVVARNGNFINSQHQNITSKTGKFHPNSHTGCSLQLKSRGISPFPQLNSPPTPLLEREGSLASSSSGYSPFTPREKVGIGFTLNTRNSHLAVQQATSNQQPATAVVAVPLQLAAFSGCSTSNKQPATSSRLFNQQQATSNGCSACFLAARSSKLATT